MKENQRKLAEERRPCPVCELLGGKPHHFSSGSWRVVRCDGCGMVYLENPPAQSTLGEEFAWEHTAQSERLKRRQGRQFYYLVSDAFKRVKHWIRRKERKELGIIGRLCPEGGSVLDIGCAGGATLQALANSGRQFRLFGIEPSPALAKRADELCRAYGGRVEHATALEGLPNFLAGSFDLVVMRSYLEHEVFASRVLREVIRLLKPGGGLDKGAERGVLERAIAWA